MLNFPVTPPRPRHKPDDKGTPQSHTLNTVPPSTPQRTPIKSQNKAVQLDSVCEILGLKIIRSPIFSTKVKAVTTTYTPEIKELFLKHLSVCHIWINGLAQGSEISEEGFTPTVKTKLLIDLTVTILTEIFPNITLDNAKQCSINLIILVKYSHSTKGKFSEEILPFITFLQDGDGARISFELNPLSGLDHLSQNHVTSAVFTNLRVKNIFEMKEIAGLIQVIIRLDKSDFDLICKMLPCPHFAGRKKSLAKFLKTLMSIRPWITQIQHLDFTLPIKSANFTLTAIFPNLGTEENKLASFMLEKCIKNKLTIGEFLKDFTLTYSYAKCIDPFLANGINILPIVISYCSYDPDPTPERFHVIVSDFNNFLRERMIDSIKDLRSTALLFCAYFMYYNDKKSINKLSTSLVPSAVDNVVRSISGICNVFPPESEVHVSKDELEQIIFLGITIKETVMADTSCRGHLFSKTLTGLNHAVLLFNNHGVYTILIKPNVHNDEVDNNMVARGGEKTVKLHGIEITFNATENTRQYQRVVTVSRVHSRVLAYVSEYVRVKISTHRNPSEIGRPIYYTKYLGRPLNSIFGKLTVEERKSVILQLFQKFELSYKDVKMANVLIDDEHNVSFIDYTSNAVTYTVRGYNITQPPSDPAIKQNAILGLCTILFELCNFNQDEAVKLALDRVAHLNLRGMPTRFDSDDKPLHLAKELFEACESKLTLEELCTAVHKLYPDIAFVRE